MANGFMNHRDGASAGEPMAVNFQHQGDPERELRRVCAAP